MRSSHFIVSILFHCVLFTAAHITPLLLQLKIGAILDMDDIEEDVILKLAVEQINRDPLILPNHHLTVKSEISHSENSYHAAKHVCNLLSEGIVGVFGPQSSGAASHTQSLCDRYDIPHIETKWDYRTRQNKYAINIFPHPDSLGEAFTNLVDEWEWDRFVILYDADDRLFKLQGLIKASIPSKRNVFLRQLPSGHNFRPLLKSLQRDYDIKKFIIDTEVTKTIEILKQAQEIGLIRFDYEYILTTMKNRTRTFILQHALRQDTQPWDLDAFRFGDAEFVSFRMVDPEKTETMRIIAELNELEETTRQHYTTCQPHSSPQQRGISTSEALVFDSLKLFGKALDENVRSIQTVPPIVCGRDDAWTKGSSIINAMRSMEPFQGLTGIVQFNNSGYRTDIVLDVIELTTNGLRKTGVWEYARHFKNRFVWIEPDVDETQEENDGMPVWNRTLKVVTIMTNPMCMHALSESALHGNQRYVGFIVDLIEELSKRMGFKYFLKLVDDGTHDGMITELLEGKGDMVVADLTVTRDRQKILDFTMPFMNLGISILFTKPQAKPPSLFSFMSPFALEVWIYMVVSFFSVSFILFVVARLTPYEWDSPLPCIAEPEKLYNQFSLANSFWFTIGSLMQQGSDLAPKAVSTRMIAGTWWFFTLIMVSTYTANLATSLIVQELEDSINNLEELGAQSKIDYGCVANGSTSKFFSNSNDELKQKIWRNMQKKAEISMKTSNDDGITAVSAKPGRFAFFMESTIIEYYMERKCGFVQVGGLLDHKGYGIALSKGSPYLDPFNAEILKLQENGELDRLKRKWWKEEGKDSSEICPTTSVSDTVKALELSNVGGVFLVLACGCLVSILVTLIEFWFKSRALGLVGDSLRQEIVKDLQFSLQCRGNVKPVKKTFSEEMQAQDELGSVPYLNYNSEVVPPFEVRT